MSVLPTRVFRVAAIVLAVPAASATAQTQPPIPSQTAPPEIVRPQPTLPKERQTMPSGKADAGAHAALVGLVAFSSDGQKLGSVQNVSTGPDGKTVIFLRTGGFLGFGARIVAVPEAKFTRSGDFIQLGMTVQEVSKLPGAKD
jgi:PRC-barrel domain